MQFVSPYLNFKGNAEEAFEFYRSVFGGEINGIVRFRDMGGAEMGIPDGDLDKVAHISMPLVQDIGLMASDVVGPDADKFNVGNNVYLYIEAESAEEAERVFSGLSAGGNAEMPLQPTGWAEKYGSCVDKYGVQWMISYTGSVQFGAQ